MSTLPNGPKSAFLQLFNLRDPFPALLKLAKEYGDPMSYPAVGQPPWVFTWDPAGIKAIFSEDPSTYASSMTDGIDVLGPGSLFLLEGSDHLRARKMLAPPFHGDRMRAYGALMRDLTLRAMASWQIGQTRPVIDVTQAITLDVIIEAVFGVSDKERMARFHKDIVDAIAAFNPLLSVKLFQRDFFGLGPWANFQRRREGLRALMQEEIDAKRASPGEDILSMLIAARDEQGEGLSDDEIKDQLFTLVMAGHETTAASLAWLCYELLRRPDALERLQQELAPYEKDLDPAANAKLPYLDAVWQETLRLYPVLPLITRKLRRPFTLKGHELPAGTTLAAAAYLAHHREETFPEPAAFKPERFLGKTFAPFEYLPFGGGARRCLGAAFATYEMKIVLATLLARHRFALAEEKPVKAILRAASMGPKGGVRLTLSERR